MFHLINPGQTVYHRHEDFCTALRLAREAADRFEGCDVQVWQTSCTLDMGAPFVPAEGDHLIACYRT